MEVWLSEKSGLEWDAQRGSCSECQRSSLVQLSQQQSLFHRGRAETTREILVRDMKEKDRVGRAVLSCDGWPVSFKFLVVDMVCLWREGPFFPSCRLVASVVLRELSMC